VKGYFRSSTRERKNKLFFEKVSGARSSSQGLNGYGTKGVGKNTVVRRKGVIPVGHERG